VQQTLASDVKLVGTGLHSGRPARICASPAPVGHGIVFERMDVNRRNAKVPARWDRVSDTVLNTRVSNEDGVEVSTIEHLMSAIAGCGIHNALIKIDGPEVPIFDGSALRFAKAFLDAGVVPQDAPVDMIRILRIFPTEPFCVSWRTAGHFVDSPMWMLCTRKGWLWAGR